MAIPIAYNFRNLVVRRTTTLMTALGIGLTVAVLVADLALVNGLKQAFQSTGQPLDVLVLRKGGTAELSSAMSRTVYQELKTNPGIARDSAGQPMASLEMVAVISLAGIDSSQVMSIAVRGVDPIGRQLRDIHVVDGRWFQPGRREVVVGRSVASRYPEAHLGRQIRFGKGLWTVVGVMDAGQSAFNSEIWGDLNQITSDFNRQDTASSVLLRAADAAAVPALINSLNDDRRLNVTAMREQTYYDNQTNAGAPLQILGIFVSIIMAVGSSFAAMNTMFAAVSRRATEIGTLRVLGFSRFSILTSFFFESLLLAGIGGVLGCLLALPLNGMTTAVGNFTTFSEIAFHFRVTPGVMMPGVIFALVLGAAGGLLPARSAARKEILSALREG
ncbi:MAG TPA: ABC transporter permease [Bryobacteraceae bacterium]|nr:ABC transporter permease [Bryobacteraceae bacterium]